MMNIGRTTQNNLLTLIYIYTQHYTDCVLHKNPDREEEIHVLLIDLRTKKPRKTNRQHRPQFKLTYSIN